jgi:hypothetical protein
MDKKISFLRSRPRKIRCEICGKVLKASLCLCTSPRFKGGRLVKTSRPNPKCVFCHGTGISYVCPNLFKHRSKKITQLPLWKTPSNTYLGKAGSGQKFKPKGGVASSKKSVLFMGGYCNICGAIKESLACSLCIHGIPTCTGCGGTGRISVCPNTSFHTMNGQRCIRCSGSGVVIINGSRFGCGSCGGTGRPRLTSTIGPNPIGPSPTTPQPPPYNWGWFWGPRGR